MNFFYYDKTIVYPECTPYSPGKDYPEYPFGTSQGIEENHVYRSIRNIFYQCELDKGNFGSSRWNPLGCFIKPGDTVLIKPNLVLHENKNKQVNLKEGLECLITHPSICRAVFDYVYIALKGRGEIIIADAPVQSCDIKKLLHNSGYYELLEFLYQFRSSNLSIVFSDLRERKYIIENGYSKQVPNSDCKYNSKIVDIGNDSHFAYQNCKGLRITGYHAHDTLRHHKKGKNEYSISEALLKSNVVISLPKPKSHRIAGYTGALKNFIGINANKEYLPHHKRGKNGDEYNRNHVLLKAINGNAYDIINWSTKHNIKPIQSIGKIIASLAERKLNHFEPDSYRFGMWYGNDTLWRTILDVYYIVKYVNPNGKKEKEVQRKILYLGDMIISGEGEGPLSPNPKKIGGLLFSDDAIIFDLILTKIMGYEYVQFPTLRNAVKKYIYSEQIIEHKQVLSNDEEFNKPLQKINKTFNFKLAKGWKEIVQKDENTDT